MRSFITLLFALLSIGAASAQNFNLISGQRIAVRLMTSVDSENRMRTAPTAIVDANVVDEQGNILIRRGTNVVINTNTQHRKGLGKPGYVKVDCLTTTAVDGQTIYLMGGLETAGKNREALAVGLGIGGGIVAFPFGLFLLCIKGEEAYIQGNTIIANVVVDDNYTIKY